MDYATTPEAGLSRPDDLAEIKVAAWRYSHLLGTLGKFTLRPIRYLDALQWKIPHSEIEAQASLTSFSQPAWDFVIAASLISRIFAHPRNRALRRHVEFTGEGKYAGNN